MSLASVIRQYGEAFRGDWGDIDGRSVRTEMYDIATWLDDDTYPGDDSARGMLGICPFGLGHWETWCSHNCAADAKENGL